MKHHNIILSSFLAGLCLISACTKEEPLNIPEPPQEQAECQCLPFSVGMSGEAPYSPVVIDSLRASGFQGAYFIRSNGEDQEAPATKAAPVENLTTYGSFALFGYIYDSWSTSCKPNFMFGEKVQYASSEWKTVSAFNTHLGDRGLRFYGYAPYGASGVSVASSVAGPLAFNYSVPTAVADQNDLLVGASPEYTGEMKNLSIAFGHCLSAVTFKTGTETVNGTIKSISLKGIYSKGKYTYGSGWSSLSSASNFTFSSNVSVAEGSSKNITSGRPC